MKSKLLFVVAMGMLLALGLIGCSSGGNNASSSTTTSPTNQPAAQEEKVEIRIAWWGSQDRHDKTLQALDLFMEKHPNIEVIPEFTGWDDYWNKINTQAAGANLPDVMQMHEGVINEYVSRNLFVDLNPFVEQGILNLDNVDANYLPDRVDGKLWGINMGTNSVTMYYDPALFEQAGVEELQPGYTYDDLMVTLRAIKAKMGDDFYGLTLPNPYDAFKHYVRQNGTMFYSADGKKLGYEDDQIFIDHYTYWLQLINEGLAPPPEVNAEFNTLENSLLVHGRAAMQQAQSNQVVALSSASNRPLKMLVYPTLPGGVEGHFFKAAMSFAVTSHSKHPEAAAKLIDYLTNDIEVNEILAAERGIPISSVIRNSLIETVPDSTKQMFTYIESVQPYAREADPPAPAGDNEIRTLIQSVTDQIFYGRITPEEGARLFRTDAEEILSRSN